MPRLPVPVPPTSMVPVDMKPLADRMLPAVVTERNLSLITPDDDYWVTQWISRGLRSEFRSGPTGEPTVIIECSPLPFKMRARGMRDGLDVVTPPSIRRTPPEAISPRMKSLSYANLTAGDQEVQSLKPGATADFRNLSGDRSYERTYANLRAFDPTDALFVSVCFFPHCRQLVRPHRRNMACRCETVF